MGKKRSSATWQGRPRLRDVAIRADVSTATVSRVINAPTLVAEEVKERVRGAMNALGYVPNSAARTLRSRRSRMIGIVIPTLNYALYARLVESLETALNEFSYSLLVATFEYDPHREREQIQLLLERGAEAMVLIGEARDPDIYSLLDLWKVPYTINYIFNAGSKRPCIGFDNFAASARSTQFLLDLGHRHFGVLAGVTVDNDRTTARLAGVRHALQARGFSLPDHHVFEARYGIAQGRAGLRKLLSEASEITAIVCANDILATGAVLEAQANGLAVPDDISIIGMDDLELASHLKPALTTVRVPAREMGELSAHYLVDRLSGEKVILRECLGAELMRRGTTAAPRERLLPPLRATTG